MPSILLGLTVCTMVNKTDKVPALSELQSSAKDKQGTRPEKVRYQVAIQGNGYKSTLKNI